MTTPDLMTRNFITEMPWLPYLPTPSERPSKGSSNALGDLVTPSYNLLIDVGQLSCGL